MPSRINVALDAVVGGQYGSEGKGHICAWLASEYDILIRVGSSNAGHTVVADDGKCHVARQLPSGVQESDAIIVIGPGAIIDADILVQEIESQGLTEYRLAIDQEAILIETHDRDLDRASYASIATTGSGASSASVRRIVERAGTRSLRFSKDDPRLRPFCLDTVAFVRELTEAGRASRVLLEGTQGAGLSLYHGSYPFVTARDTTVGTLLAEAGLPWSWLRRVVMVCRRYPIRVGGRSGPLERELDWAVIEGRAGVAPGTFAQLERGSVSGRLRRVAEFDVSRIRKAAYLNGATDIALTCVDQASAVNRDIRKYASLDASTRAFVRDLESMTRVPVSLIATGPARSSIIDRRGWRCATST